MIHFPVSGVETHWWVPTPVAFGISLFTSMGGVSGAVLILPFQVSVLGFVSPAVSSTNLLYNLVAIPSGVWRYVREGRMVWPLAWAIVLGTMPGMLVGAVLRLRFFPDPARFKLFAGAVLLYVGGKMPEGATLRYGAGRDPYCNLRDEAGMAAPVFGPLAVQ